ncbi:hypothetical protein ELI30_00930 [Rhizobium leguminosarum]|nr:hypothetical protein ELI32_00930 [Rhizobium leguminosarum]TAV56480.1 hypothetical protein ELI31_00930 [Rhizobium leguminosarum]TAV67416.1 hypothetical protein ELI30_00930 [Rhizobium leguminosarum]
MTEGHNAQGPGLCPRRMPLVLLATVRASHSASFHRLTRTAHDRQSGRMVNLDFHDLRGTAATKFHTVVLPERVIAEIMGWSEDEVRGIIRRYVDRNAATRAMIAQINAGVKLPVKPDENSALEQE